MNDTEGFDRLSPVRPGRRWLRRLGLIVLFVSGMAVGGGATVLVAVHRIQHAVHHPEEAADRITNRLHRRLGLSETQTAQVREIIAARQASLQSIRRKVQPEVEAELDRAREQISAVLTPEQAAKWHGIIEELRRNWLPTPPAGRG